MESRQRLFVFRLRAFVSLLNLLSFLAMSISGVVLFIAPSGRRAAGWTVGALSRDHWIALHLSFSAVFLIAALVHLWLNRRPLMAYITLKSKALGQLRWEWAAVLLLTGLIAWGAIRPLEPFTSLIQWRDRFHRSGLAGAGQTHSREGGAGQITLDAYCRQIGLEVGQAVEILEKEGIPADRNDSLRTIADRGGLHPSQLRRLLETAAP